MQGTLSRTLVLTGFLTAILLPLPAHAQTFKVLHTFKGKDGAFPEGALVRDAAGNLYGTTAFGGTGRCRYGGVQQGCGTAFMLNKAGKLVGVYSFDAADGQEPTSGFIRDGSGNFYGASAVGGDPSCPPYGCGLIYEMSPKGKETMIRKFSGPPGEFSPGGPLAEDAAGNLYAIAAGGEQSMGAVIKVDRFGNESLLYSFTGGADGCAPAAGVVLDAAGNIYGVTTLGGFGFCNSGSGVVFKLDTAGNFTVLHTFGGVDGANPSSVLLLDSDGNLYGTTQNGGTSQGCGFSGCGTVFEVSPQKDGTWSETVLYSFCSLPQCADGERPMFGPLVRDTSGNIYGTTSFGGSDDWGTAFWLGPGGVERVLHSFTGGADGADPFAGLIMDKTGNLYGTAAGGGMLCTARFSCGVVFEISP